MNVQACDEDNVLDIFTNVGSQRYLSKGTLKLLPIKVHMKTKPMEKCLYFKDVTTIPGLHITTDTVS